MRRAVARVVRFAVGGPSLAVAQVCTTLVDMIDTAAANIEGSARPARRPLCLTRNRQIDAVRSLFSYGFDTAEIAAWSGRGEAEIVALLDAGRASIPPIVARTIR